MDLARLRKVHALTTSPVPGEAAAARGRVEAMLAADGKTVRDLPALLFARTGEKVAPAPPGYANLRTFLAHLRDLRDTGRTRRPMPPLAAMHPDLPFLHDHVRRLTDVEVQILLDVTLRPKLRKKDGPQLSHLATTIRNRMAQEAAHV